MLKRLGILFALLILLPTGFVSAADPAIDPKVALHAYSALVDLQFEDTRDALRILAATENAKSGDWQRIKGPLLLLAKSTPTNAAVWFARPDGTYFTVDAGRTAQNLKDRSYFPALMAGKEVASELVISKSTGKRSAIIAVPVRSKGRIVGALGVSVAMEKIAAFIDNKIAFPEGVTFYALDSHGQIALHRETPLLFEFAAQLGSPTLANAIMEMLSRPEGAVHYDFEGARRTAIFSKSTTTGWVYALRW